MRDASRVIQEMEHAGKLLQAENIELRARSGDSNG